MENPYTSGSCFYDSFTTLHTAANLPHFKMASSFWKGVVGVGLFALAHAAFSAAQRTLFLCLWLKRRDWLVRSPQEGPLLRC